MQLGNEPVKVLLQNLLKEESLRQVLLFSGPEGTPKAAFVKSFLQDYFGSQHAAKIAEDVHPDIKWIKPEGKTKLHAVSSIKEMLDGIFLVPFEAPKKVYVIEEAERMLPAAANTLLKILEEPPAHVLFLLITSYEEAMLPTIISRCTRVPFYSLGLENVEEDPLREQFVQILSLFFLRPPCSSLIEALEDLGKLIEKKEQEAASQIADAFFSDLLFWVRDLHYMQVSANPILFHKKYLPQLKAQASGKIPSLEKSYALIEEARLALQRHSKPKVVLERLFSSFSCSL